jgi:hypothetical protein
VEISITCNADNIVSVVQASSQTLQAVKLTGDCRLDTSEILALGHVLQQCAKLGSFTLSDVNPKDVWDNSLALHSPHGAAVIECTTKLIKVCPLLTQIKLVYCHINDNGASSLATAIGNADRLIDLQVDISSNYIHEGGIRALLLVIARFKSLVGVSPETAGGVRLLINTLSRATNLQLLEVDFYVQSDADDEAGTELEAKCQELGIHFVWHRGG